MRKEVKRSMLLWPIAASATITAMSWVSTQMPGLVDFAPRAAQIAAGGQIAAGSQSVESTIGHAVFPLSRTEDALASIAMDGIAAPIDRNEFGSRGVRLPDRVAGVFGQGDRLPLMAPVRREQEELAGLVLAPASGTDQLIDDLTAHLFEFDYPVAMAKRHGVVAAVTTGVPVGVSESISVGVSGQTQRSNMAADLLMGARILQSLRNREHDAPQADRWAFENTEPSQMLALEPPGLSLPKSNRVLARPAANKSSSTAGSLGGTPVLEARPTTDGSLHVSDVPNVSLDRSKLSTERTIPTIDVEPLQAEQSFAPESQPGLGLQPGLDIQPGPSVQPSGPWPAGWPVTTRLHDQLDAISAITDVDPSVHAASMGWADDVTAKLASLRRLPRLGDADAGALIADLVRLADQGEADAEACQERELQVAWLRAVHAIRRRTEVWQPIWQVTRNQGQTWMSTDATPGKAGLPSRQEVLAAIETVRGELDETGDPLGWTAYLLLDEIKDAADGRTLGVASREERSIVAQRLLSRLSWHALQEDHLRWLDRRSVSELADLIRPWARGAVDYADLISQIERQESDAIDLAAIDIADAVQTLRFAQNPDAAAIAEALGTYYRNANVRLAVSQDMLNRMLPTIDPQSVPVNTTMMGSRVRGTSQIQSDLRIQLEPAADQWSLKLQTLGNVTTRSTGSSGPVSVLTSGTSNFVAATPIQVRPDGVYVGDVAVDVRGRTKLHGIRTEYDRWPLVGSLVQSIAKNRYDSMVPVTTRIANRKIESQVKSEIDTRIDTQVGEATEKLSEMLLGPLASLRLDPQVIDMGTTEDRLLARYRLAGDWQLAAFTPRPRAPRDSLMSVQVHQSAVNNTLEQLVPRDQPMAIDEVITRAAKVFGQSIEIPDDMPEGVTIQFARTRPITVEIEDGKMWVTMRIVRLARGDQMDLTQFIVRAAYRPEVDGLRANLVRDGHLRISGPGMSMRERLPVRAIFNKVLASSNKLPLTMPVIIDHPSMAGLQVSQLELRGGWLGMALGGPYQLATRQTQATRN